MTRDELLATVRRDRAALDGAVAQLRDAQKLEPVLDAGWSVKDVLAHISAWERTATRWLDEIDRGVMTQRPEVGDVDATNARFYAAAKDAPRSPPSSTSRARHTRRCSPPPGR